MTLLARISRHLPNPQAAQSHGVPEPVIQEASRLLYAPVAPVEPPVPSIKNVVDAQDRIPDRSRAGGTNGLIHVSSLVTPCARREVIAPQAATPPTKSVTGAHRLVWAYGRAGEKHVRDQYIAANPDWQLWGQWECLCGTSHQIGTKPPAGLVCARCQTDLDQYKEVPVIDDGRMLVGNPDMPLQGPEDWYVVGEIKTMNKKEWDELKHPKADHVLQAATYRRMREEQGWRMHSHVVIIYACKEFRFGSPYKEFPVDVTTGMIATQVDDLLATAEEIATHRRAGTVPARTVCQSHNSSIAKQCPVCALCFNLPSE